MKKVLIIAEAGVNHNGDIGIAKKLIESGAHAGADIVKFQTFKTELLVTRDARQADYQSRNSGRAESQYDMLRRLELNSAAHEVLIGHCKLCGVEFLSTAFDHSSVDLLASFLPKLWKVPSGEITNLPYLRRVGAQKTPILLSTGMATLSDIERALSALEAAGARHEDITVLHCTTEYPTPWDEVNLMAMVTIREAFKVAVGYSDHTPGIEVPTAAVALGATVIEKHFTLDRSLPGPDHKASLEPSELQAMVSAIRNIERALGNGIKLPTESEKRNIPIARKSLVATRRIQLGELMTAENIGIRRPGTGRSPMDWDSIIGVPATRQYEPDDLID